MLTTTLSAWIKSFLRNTAAAALLSVFACVLYLGTCYAATDVEGVAPEIDGFTINNGDLITDRHEITFQLEARDSITPTAELEIRLSGDAATWSPWAPYVASGDYLLDGCAGARFLYIEVRNQSGNSVRAAASIVVYVPVAGIRLAPERLLLVAGGTPAELTAEVIPGNASHDQLVWSSSDDAVARVSEGSVIPGEPGSAVITATTADGSYSASCAVEVRPAVVPLEMVDPDLYGDLDGNGTVDVSDAITLLRYITGHIPLAPEQQRLGDVNEDGAINVADAVLILRYIVGLVDKLPAEPGPPGEDEPPPGGEEEEEPAPPGPAIVAPNSKLLNATYRVRTLGTVTCTTLNVRYGPGVDHEIIGTLSQGVSRFIREIAHTGDSSYPLWYRVDYGDGSGWICANYVSADGVLYGLDHALNEYRLAPAPGSLATGDYKIDAQYNFYRLEGGSRIPTGVNFYFLEHNPYAILPLERPAPDFVTTNYLSAEVRRNSPDSPLADAAGGFIDAQRAWGLNALYLAAHAAHESAWGKSSIAQGKNNILGFMAYDSSPYASAATFKTKEACALYVGGYIRRAYLSEGGTYFNGCNLLGMNEKYATDPMWAIKISRVMQNITSFSGYTPVEKQPQQGFATAALNLRSGAGTGYPVITTISQGALLQIFGMVYSGDTGWFKALYQGNSGWCSSKDVALQTCPDGAIFYSGWYNMDVPDRINVRREPHTGADVLGQLNFADSFTVVDIEMACDSSGKWYPWYRIESGGITGWVRGDLALIDW